MRTLKQITLISLITIFGVTQTGCFGKFALVRKLYTWNDSLGNKFAKSAVLWVFFIIPVYSIATFIDLVILNLIEFWTGSNPIAMKPGEKETQVVAWRGEKYQITATQNRFHIEQLSGLDKGKITELLYRKEDKSWNAIAGCQDIKLVSFSETCDHQEQVTFYKPDGSTTTILTSEPIASIQQRLNVVYALK